MRKSIPFYALAGLLIFAACSKSTDSPVVPPAAGDPKKGSTWTFKFTYYNEAGTVTGTNNQSFVADTMTVSGSQWTILEESTTGQAVIGIQKRADGWWWIPFPNTTPSLWFKSPASVGDKYNYNISDFTVDTSKVRNIAATVTVPAGTYTGCTFIQSFDTNSMEDEWYFVPTGPVLVRTSTFDNRSAGPGEFEKQRSELVSYTQ